MSVSKLMSGLAAAALIAASLSVCAAPADAATVNSCSYSGKNVSTVNEARYQVTVGSCASGKAIVAQVSYSFNPGAASVYKNKATAGVNMPGWSSVVGGGASPKTYFQGGTAVAW